jgi:hypothetical protein
VTSSSAFKPCLFDYVRNSLCIIRYGISSVKNDVVKVYWLELPFAIVSSLSSVLCFGHSSVFVIVLVLLATIKVPLACQYSLFCKIFLCIHQYPLGVWKLLSEHNPHIGIHKAKCNYNCQCLGCRLYLISDIVARIFDKDISLL